MKFVLSKRFFSLCTGLLATVVSVIGAPRVEDAITDPGFGQSVFRRDCALCHYAGPGSSGGGQGPSLVGVLGATAGMRSDFSYTKAMRESGIVWNEANLDRFLANPTSVVPGTTMVVNVPQPNSRRDLIAYLATLKKNGASEPTVDLAYSDPNDWRHQSPGRSYLIRAEDLPPPNATPLSRNFPFVVTKPESSSLQVPAGFSARVVASNLDGPRLVQVAPNGDIFMTEMRVGRVRVLRLREDTGSIAADEIFAEGLYRPYGISFYPGGENPQWLYVANSNSVVRLPYRRGDLKVSGAPQVVVPVITKSRGGHGTRSLAFSLDGKRMFIGVGSSTNAGEDLSRKSPGEIAAWEEEHGLGVAWDADLHRADILVTDPAGKTPLRVYASGLRNPTGLAVDPRTGELYAAVNERDSLGDNLVPDYFTRVRQGAFYGWPWYYLGQHEDPRHSGARPDLAGKITVPDVLVQAHSAALGIVFYEATSGAAVFPAEYRGDAFVALHGSWNRQSRTGYSVVRVKMRDGRPTGEYEDFLVGFVSGPRNVWGRPVGLAVAHDGALLVTDDENGTLWRVSGPGEKAVHAR
ncbi:MAG: PQQ-dependent sugar dehydrogenase [Opitutaceae bacterium]|nr:PQQ-dependent sugar dehydrogenase [Opitutaceae bacterium]